MNVALHLHAQKRIRRAAGAAMHMSIEGAHLLRRKLTVEVSIEF
jgi:hypothetical protein